MTTRKEEQNEGKRIRRRSGKEAKQKKVEKIKMKYLK